MLTLDLKEIVLAFIGGGLVAKSVKVIPSKSGLTSRERLVESEKGTNGV